jgi:hypothetical protein
MTSAQPQLRQKYARARPDQREHGVRPPAETAVPPEKVWATLTPSLQSQIRQRLLRITQEVLHEPSHH